jgi:WD40 repeat protein
VACSLDENRVVIHDLNTGEQKEIEVETPFKCASSQHFIAVTAFRKNPQLLSTDGAIVHTIPDSTDVYCIALHPRNTNYLAVGCEDGSVRLWDMSSQSYSSTFKEHSDLVSSIRFAPDCRLLLTSVDNNASIITLDDQLQFVSSIKFKGHIDRVFDILPLPISNQCVTGSLDATIRVWDCETGACLRTLTEHTDSVTSLAVHPNGQCFASASHDQSVIIWSSETFEILRRIMFPDGVHSIVFGEGNTLYAGLSGFLNRRGIMSCNAFTGEVGPVIIPEIRSCERLTFGKTPLCTPQSHHSHS